MSARDNWAWLSRVTDLGQLGIWSVTGAVVVAGIIARSGYLSGLARSEIATLFLATVVLILAGVRLVVSFFDRQPMNAERPTASPSELYTIEAARKHQAAAETSQAAFWKAETDKLRLEQEAERIRQRVAELEHEVSTSKTSAAEVTFAFNEVINFFQKANQRAVIADKAIIAIRRAIQPRFSGLLSDPPPNDDRITEAEKVITEYMNDRVNAIREENANPSPPTAF
jgi:hypothetical protein